MADNLIGLEPNQIPVHAHFGGMAYQQPNAVNITDGTIGDMPVAQLVAGAGGNVKTVCGKGPDGNGNVVLVAADVGLPVPTIAQAQDTAGTAAYAWTGERLNLFVNAMAGDLVVGGALIAAKLANARNIAGVPFDGSADISIPYGNLTGLPTIPAAQVSSDWSASTGVAQILNKPSTMSQAEAEAGTASTVRMLTSQRVRQNVAAYAYSKTYIDDMLGDVEAALDAILGV